jgi:hypothetical protein
METSPAKEVLASLHCFWTRRRTSFFVVELARKSAAQTAADINTKSTTTMRIGRILWDWRASFPGVRPGDVTLPGTFTM